VRNLLVRLVNKMIVTSMFLLNRAVQRLSSVQNFFRQGNGIITSQSPQLVHNKSNNGQSMQRTHPEEDATFKSSQDDFRPRRIILIRTGESEGVVDEFACIRTPDWRIPLTPKGRQHARDAGKLLRKLIGKDSQVLFVCSPYERTRETVDKVRAQLDSERQHVINSKEDPRISQQQKGNFKSAEEVTQAKLERARFGRFYYRFKNGEAGLDVYNRVSSFVSSLVRDCHQYKQNGYDLENMNVVIVTHGSVLRLFLMRFFQFSVQEFEDSENPVNAQLIPLIKTSGLSGHKWYELENEARRTLNLPKTSGVPKSVHLHSLR